MILHLSLTPLVIYSCDLSIFMDLVHESDPFALGSNDRARTTSSPVTDSMPFVKLHFKSAVVQTIIFFKISQRVLLQAWKDKGKIFLPLEVTLHVSFFYGWAWGKKRYT